MNTECTYYTEEECKHFQGLITFPNSVENDKKQKKGKKLSFGEEIRKRNQVRYFIFKKGNSKIILQMLKLLISQIKIFGN